MAASKRLTAAQRELRARLAASTRWSRASEAERHASGLRNQATLRAKFARELDPDGKLSPAELEKCVDSAVQAHMTRMAFESSKRRTRKAPS